MSLGNQVHSANTQMWSNSNRIQTVPGTLLSSSDISRPFAKSAYYMTPCDTYTKQPECHYIAAFDMHACSYFCQLT